TLPPHNRDRRPPRVRALRLGAARRGRHGHRRRHRCGRDCRRRAPPPHRRLLRSAGADLVASPGVKRALTALGYRDYRLFWSGAFVSNVGTWMQNVTVPYVLFHLTHRGTWVGMTIVAQ